MAKGIKMGCKNAMTRVANQINPTVITAVRVMETAVTAVHRVFF